MLKVKHQASAIMEAEWWIFYCFMYYVLVCLNNQYTNSPLKWLWKWIWATAIDKYINVTWAYRPRVSNSIMSHEVSWCITMFFSLCKARVGVPCTWCILPVGCQFDTFDAGQPESLPFFSISFCLFELSEVYQASSKVKHIVLTNQEISNWSSIYFCQVISPRSFL